MKFGMNLLLWSGEITDAMLPTIEQLKKIGFDGVEVPVFNLDLDYKKLGQQLDNLGLQRTAVTVRNVEDNPISPDAKARAKGVELNKKTLDCCAALGAQTLVGPYHSAIGHFSGNMRTADEWKWGVESMRAAAEHAGKVGVMLGVEPLNRFETYLLNAQADAAQFCREVNHSHCRMMYDTFHANIEEKSISQALHAVKTCYATFTSAKMTAARRDTAISIGNKPSTRFAISDTMAGLWSKHLVSLCLNLLPQRRFGVACLMMN